jgi:hypothetical protein
MGDMREIGKIQAVLDRLRIRKWAESLSLPRIWIRNHLEKTPGQKAEP